ncbi:hypothetical protein JIN84_09820 [Luteolibacter yonseiensis]|uniref:Uncharacterized protein n=1 Tax=Luteolibacter yonseiensis TaxID=1144680 RepID=A0A934VBG6_9BACT|nr:hypothetical protein [Luteolibacter yonseiensis]MBK1815916.1 hypothetical protein [Luteolibacter yonseiensis]
MKHAPLPKTESRFAGTRRYYHRAGSNHPRTWDEWVGDTPPKSDKTRNWPKIIGIAAAVLALVAILAGLTSELV